MVFTDVTEKGIFQYLVWQTIDFLTYNMQLWFNVTNYIKYITFSVVMVTSDENEYRLMRNVMREYDVRIRPSRNSSEAINVTFGLALAQIIDVVSIMAYIELRHYYKNSLIFMWQRLFVLYEANTWHILSKPDYIICHKDTSKLNVLWKVDYLLGAKQHYEMNASTDNRMSCFDQLFSIAIKYQYI